MTTPDLRDRFAMAGTDDLLDGYRDGFADHRDELPEATNRSSLYAFGWANGRDDRRGNPRATAQELRDRLASLVGRGERDE